MQIDYKKLGIHRNASLKVDYGRLKSVGMPERKGIRADLELLGVYRVPADPSYSELLSKNLKTVLEELASWRVPMRTPKFRWTHVLLPAAGALCLCFIMTVTGVPAAGIRTPGTEVSVAAEIGEAAEARNAYMGSRNTDTVNTGQLVQPDTTSEDFEAAVPAEMGEAPGAEWDTEVSVLPTEALEEYPVQDNTQDVAVTVLGTQDLADYLASAGEIPSAAQEEQTASDDATRDVDGDVPGDDTEESPEIVMAAVTGQLNVRTEPSVDAELAGALYPGCGGTVLEHGDGWTLIESGNLVGWASDDWLLTGDDAEEKLEETGHLVAMVDVNNLNVRTEPTTESDVVGHVARDDELEISLLADDGAVDEEGLTWAEVEFNGKTAYICTDYAVIKMQYDTGSTVDEIKEKAQAKGTDAAEVSMGTAYEGSASELEMLATIIYCEAGNQPYEGKVAVGNVVLNRMASEAFPDDMDSVLRASGQFSPVASGKYDRMLNSGKVPESCYEAAQDAMGGISFVGGCLYFKNPSIAGWHAGTTIQDHVFW